MRLIHADDDADARVAARALALAGVDVAEVVDDAASLRLRLADGGEIEGLIGILNYAQDAGAALTPSGFDRYRVAEVVNTLLTEVSVPLAMLARLDVDEEHRRRLATAIGRQLAMIDGERADGRYLIGTTRTIADVYAAAIVERVAALDASLVPATLTSLLGAQGTF